MAEVTGYNRDGKSHKVKIISCLEFYRQHWQTLIYLTWIIAVFTLSDYDEADESIKHADQIASSQ
jgi:hypothetical protein